MKKIQILIGVIIILFIAGFSVSCDKKGSPKSVIRQFYKAVESGNKEEFKNLMVPGEDEVMLIFADKAKGMVEAKGGTSGIKKIEETFENDKAIVKTTFKDGTTEELHLLNIDGEWRITLEK
ncbi:MAG: DUF4878 domain-containing protein [Treponema sp.]|nr:DUF4878 domain-containing protein [Treponema sp.]MCL2272889.1 DUF4878 domain-containing protein [Treponema sp.]